MAFVKLDCGILDSTLWIERECREVFITALLMARPVELKEPSEQINVRSTEPTGWSAAPGWYGFVEAAGPGIIRRAGVDLETGLAALEKLGEPDAESRTPDHDGRRMIRVDGGYLVLNYDKYRQKDHTAAERARRYREKKSSQCDTTTSQRDVTDKRVTGRSVTQAEAEAEAYISSPTASLSPAAAASGPKDDSGGDQDLSLKAPSSPRSSMARANSKKLSTDGELCLDSSGRGLGALAWDAYASAYQTRYGVAPVRNAKVNGIMANLVKRLPADEAGHVISWYVRSNSAQYVRAKHPVDLLLRDCEGLRTEWATGRQVTQTQAAQADRTQANFGVFGKLLSEAKGGEA